MNTIYWKRVALKTLIVLAIAHIPHLLLLLGLEFILIIVWVGLLENIPLLFLDVGNMEWFELNEFGISDYTWEGRLIVIASKCIVFFFLVALFEYYFVKKHKDVPPKEL